MTTIEATRRNTLALLSFFNAATASHDRDAAIEAANALQGLNFDLLLSRMAQNVGTPYGNDHAINYRDVTNIVALSNTIALPLMFPDGLGIQK